MQIRVQRVLQVQADVFAYVCECVCGMTKRPTRLFNPSCVI